MRAAVVKRSLGCGLQRIRCQLYESSQCRSLFASKKNNGTHQPEVTQRDGGKNAERPQIKIPKRIKRGPTDILDALSDTVKPSGPPYGYHDDPYLLPYGHIKTSSGMLSKASGQRAAQYFIRKYPKFFQLNPFDPLSTHPPGWAVERLIRDDSLQALQQRIRLQKPEEAHQVYKNRQMQGESVPDEDVEKLFQLLCAFNGQNPPDVDAIVKFYEKVDNEQVEKHNHPRISPKNTWRENMEADSLFEEMKEPSADAYNSLVRARAMYGHISGANELFKTMKEKGIPVTLETYNELIRVPSGVPLEKQFDICKELLMSLKNDGLVPNIDTFNGVLNALFAAREKGKPKNGKVQIANLANMILNEMKALSIEPTLTTWYYIMRIHFLQTNNVLSEILDHLQGKNLTVSQEIDYEFFGDAMFWCLKCQDLELAEKVRSVADFGTNRRLIGRLMYQNRYHANYFRLLCTFQQIDTIMDYYYEHFLSPGVYNATEEFLTAIDLNEGHHHLPNIWEDFKQADRAKKKDVFSKVFEIMTKKQDEELQKKYTKMVDDIAEHIRFDSDFRGRIEGFKYHGHVLGDMIQIYLNSDEFSKAWEIFVTYKVNKLKMEGYPRQAVLMQLFEACLSQGNNDGVKETLTILCHCGYPSFDELQGRALQELNLTEQERREIENLD